MTRIFKSSGFFIALRMVVGGVFLYAGCVKWLEPGNFAESIADYQLLPAIGVNPVALVLPVMEFLAGLLLVTGIWLRVAALSALLMCLAFAFALIWAIAHGLQVDCVCFGAGQGSRWTGWVALGQDMLLMGAAGCLYVRHGVCQPLCAALRES